MFGYMLLKLPPGVHKNRAVSMRAPVTCMDRTIRGANERKKVTRTILRPFENPHGTDIIYPETVSLDEERLHANIAAALF